MYGSGIINENDIYYKFKDFENSYPYADENQLREYTYRWVIDAHLNSYGSEASQEIISRYWYYIQNLRKEISYYQGYPYQNEPIKKEVSTGKKVLGWLFIIIGVFVLIGDLGLLGMVMLSQIEFSYPILFGLVLGPVCILRGVMYLRPRE